MQDCTDNSEINRNTDNIEPKIPSSATFSDLKSPNSRPLDSAYVRLPIECKTLQADGQDLLHRLLEFSPDRRVRSIFSLQRIAFFMGFNFDNAKKKKVNPAEPHTNHCHSIKFVFFLQLFQINPLDLMDSTDIFWVVPFELCYFCWMFVYFCAKRINSVHTWNFHLRSYVNKNISLNKSENVYRLNIPLSIQNPLHAVLVCCQIFSYWYMHKNFIWSRWIKYNFLKYNLDQKILLLTNKTQLYIMHTYHRILVHFKSRLQQELVRGWVKRIKS